MAHNKLDNEFREKLEQREIMPSAAAWDRLDAMLTVAEEKKSTNRGPWLFIAATLVGILLMTTFFFKGGDSASNEAPQVVQQQEKLKIESNKSGEILSPVIVTESAVAENKVDTESISEVLTGKSPNRRIKAQSAIAQSNNRPNPQTDEPKVPNRSNINTQDVNVDELLASTTNSEAGKKPVVKVDAASLLSQVDGELELSFREKVIQSAGKNFQNVKVALANRNLE